MPQAVASEADNETELESDGAERTKSSVEEVLYALPVVLVGGI